MSTTTCKQCEKPKPKSEFYACNDKKCKECIKSNARKNRRENLERAQAYDRERAKIRGSEAAREHRKRHPDRYKARTAVGNAVRDGRLIRPDVCPICNEGQPQAHHEDYSKPLEVKWCCRRCHLEKEHGWVLTKG